MALRTKLTGWRNMTGAAFAMLAGQVTVLNGRRGSVMQAIRYVDLLGTRVGARPCGLCALHRPSAAAPTAANIYILDVFLYWMYSY
jgi:hypothetical protein